MASDCSATGHRPTASSCTIGGVFTYSFASGHFTRLTRIGQPSTWLNDSRRALFTHRGRLFIVDTVSKATRELLSVAPDDFDSVALSRDNRTLYFTRETQRENLADDVQIGYRSTRSIDAPARSENRPGKQENPSA